MTFKAESLDDCTHVAPKGQFKAMTREAELRKEIEIRKRLINKWDDEVNPDFQEELIETKYQRTCRELDELEAELKGITETNSKWKQAIQKTLKELKEEVRHNVFEVELSNGINGVLKDAKVMYEFIDTTFKKNFGEKLI